jgi:hypothetical protein
MKKVIRNNQVAVLYSPGYGAGWYSWNTNFPECVYHPDIVALVELKEKYEDGRRASSFYDDTKHQAIVSQIEAKATELFGESFFAGGARDLSIAWIEEGLAFDIDDYDGCESIEYSTKEWLVA